MGRSLLGVRVESPAWGMGLQRQKVLHTKSPCSINPQPFFSSCHATQCCG